MEVLCDRTTRTGSIIPTFTAKNYPIKHLTTWIKGRGDTAQSLNTPWVGQESFSPSATINCVCQKPGSHHSNSLGPQVTEGKRGKTSTRTKGMFAINSLWALHHQSSKVASLLGLMAFPSTVLLLIKLWVSFLCVSWCQSYSSACHILSAKHAKHSKEEHNNRNR